MLPLSNISDTLRDLWQFLLRYAQQETVDPLRSLGRYLGFGLGGMALTALGVFFLALSGLRALQTQTGDIFAGFWSWVPYLLVLLVLAGLAALAVARMDRRPIDGASEVNR